LASIYPKPLYTKASKKFDPTPRLHLMTSLVYSSPFIYNLAIRLMYGKNFCARYQQVANAIPANCSVLDLCCGDAHLYSHFLQQKNVEYTGLDTNPCFVKAAETKNIPIIKQTLTAQSSLPIVDIIIIQASLYHFINETPQFIQNLLAHAKEKVIITEPVKNLSSSSNPIIRFIAQRSGNTGEQHYAQRFIPESFTELCKQFEELIELREIASGREMIAIFKGRAK